MPDEAETERHIAALKQQLLDAALADPMLAYVLSKYAEGKYTWEQAATELAAMLWRRCAAAEARLAGRDPEADADLGTIGPN